MPPPPPRPVSSEATICLQNISDGETVFQRLLLVEGTAGNGRGSIRVQHDPHSGFATQIWEVNLGHFKALIPLIEGHNSLKICYQDSVGVQGDDLSLHVLYTRPNSLPLHLAIVAASDSPVWQNQAQITPTQELKRQSLARMFGKMSSRLDSDLRDSHAGGSARALVDSPPGPRRAHLRDGGIVEVKKRFALQAYLWQAFHAEQMHRLGLGRRTFQLDDVDAAEACSSQTDNQDISLMPRIHLLRSRHTLKEFRDPNNAQQNSKARDGGAMHAFAREALQDPSTPRFLHSSPVAVLTLDTLWDGKMGLLRAHGAVGNGGQGQLSLGVMGSHWLWAAPSTLSQVTASFLDTEATHESCVNDLGECPTAWQTLNIGSGAFFHEAGHAFNNPHWPSGVMARGYVEFNRAFMTREPGCSRNGVGKDGFYAPIHSDNDDKHFHLHRAQAVRARWHPSCRLPTDPPLPYLALTDQVSWVEWNENEPTWVSTSQGASLTSMSGIGAVEIEYNGEHRTRYEWLHLTKETLPPDHLTITPAQLSELIGFDVMQPSSPSVKLTALACNMRQAELDDFRSHGIARPLAVSGISPSRIVTKSIPLGSPSNGHQQWSLILPHERDDLGPPRPVIRSVLIYSGACFDGLQFVYSDGSRAVFGPCGGSPYILNFEPHDAIAQVKVRAGAWIDAVEIILASGRTSGMRGNTTGGSLRILQPHVHTATDASTSASAGKIVGLYGSSGAWMDSIGIFTSSS